MRLSQKIALHTGIQISGKVVSLTIGLLSVSLMTRFLGTDGFGEYNTIITFLSFFSIAADFGLYLLLTREISRSTIPREEIAGNIFTLRLVSALVITSLAPVTALFFPYSIEVKRAILGGVFAFVFSSLTQVLIGVFQKEFKTQITVLGEIASRITFLVFLVWLFFYYQGENLLFLIIALTVSNFVNFVIVFSSSRAFFKIRLRFDKKYWRYIVKESFPMAAAIVLNLIYFKIDTIMLSIMKTPSDVGIYSVAYKLLEILIVFPALFTGVMLPLFSQTIKDEAPRFKLLAQQSLDFLILSAVPVVIGGYFLAKPLVALISGPSFEPAAIALRVLIIATGVIFIGNLFGHLIVAVGAQKKMVWVYFLGALTNVALNLFLIPAFSYLGASFATLVTECIVVGLAMVALKQSIKYLPSFALAKKALIAGGIMGIILLVLRDVSIFLLVPLGAVVYGAALYVVKGIPSGMMKILRI